MNKTSIPWADLTWNPITGCTRGCDYCYARKIAENPRTSEWGRSQMTDDPPLLGEVVQGREYMEGSGAFPFGFTPTIYPDRLDEPLRRKKPSVIFLGSMGDLFDPAFTDDFRDRIIKTIFAAKQHTFMLLTKRPQAMFDYMTDFGPGVDYHDVKPLRNLWTGVTVTNQADADARIPLLLDTPAAHRFVSVEPMLGPVSLNASWLKPSGYSYPGAESYLEFVIAGAKTPGKPLHEQECDASCSCPASWVRSLRDQCLAADVPLHYKHGGTNPGLDGVVYDWKPEPKGGRL